MNNARRSVVFGLGALSLAAVMPAQVFAFSTSQARALIDRAVADINSIINSGKSESVMLRDFEGIFVRYADVSTIARGVLGPVARTTSAGDMSAFTAAFQGYISRKYGRRFREFIGGKVEVLSASAIKSFFEVKCSATLQGMAPFAVDFVVASQSGKFIDMKIEGISLLKAERAEVGAMLDKRRGDLNALIKDLNAV